MLEEKKLVERMEMTVVVVVIVVVKIKIKIELLWSMNEKTPVV